MAKIELTIRRAGGTLVEFPEWPSNNVPDKTAPAAVYHFAPEALGVDGPHVANVTHRAHVDRLLSIPGYRLALDDQPSSQIVSGTVPLPPTPLAVPAPASAPLPPTASEAATVDPAVAEIVELPIRDLKARINTYSPESLASALALEQKKEDPRKGFIEVVQAHLAPPTE